MSPRSYPLLSNGNVPNNPSCPLLIYTDAANNTEDELAGHFERLFSSHDWTGTWRNGIFDMHHWHNSAHEVLGLYSGKASVQFGGEGGPVLEANAGDVIVVPAGVAHKLMSRTGHLGVVGAYAGGRRPDMCTPDHGRADLKGVVARVPLPECDPVFGPGGPLFEHWRASEDS